MGHVDFQGNMECGEADSPVAPTITPVPVQVISFLSSSTKGKEEKQMVIAVIMWNRNA